MTNHRAWFCFPSVNDTSVQGPTHHPCFPRSTPTQDTHPAHTQLAPNHTALTHRHRNSITQLTAAPTSWLHLLNAGPHPTTDPH